MKHSQSALFTVDLWEATPSPARLDPLSKADLEPARRGIEPDLEVLG